MSGLLMDDEEYDRRLQARWMRDMGRTDQPAWPEQRAALGNAAEQAGRLAFDLTVPQSPADAALALALPGPGRMLAMPLRAGLAGGLLAMSNAGDAQAGIVKRAADAARGLLSTDGFRSVFPQPQRMMPEGQAVPGGRYLEAPTRDPATGQMTGEDITGQTRGGARIEIGPDGKPVFLASPEAAQAAGGGPRIRTNLFRREAGWNWVGEPPAGAADHRFLVSVEHGGKHHYTLGTDFEGPVEMARYPTEPSEPRLRPTSRGDIELGNQVGTISVRGVEHPVYDRVYGISRADAGPPVRRRGTTGVIPAEPPPGAPEPLLGAPAARLTQDVPTYQPTIDPQTGRAVMPPAESLLDVPRETFPHLDTPAPSDARTNAGLLSERMNTTPGTGTRSGGSMDPLVNERVVFRGREPREWSPSDWGHYGRQYGVDNLGPVDDAAWQASLREYDAGGGQRISVPGGLETDAPFTYFDQLFLKSQGIDPSQMPREMHTALQRRILASVTPDANDPVAAYNGLMMGFASPNNPLFPNQIAQTRLRARSMEDIGRLADMIPWKAGDDVPAAQRAAYNKRIAEAYGLDAGPQEAQAARAAVPRVPGRRARPAVLDEQGNVVTPAVEARDAKPARPAREATEATVGGTGARGSPDYTRMAEFAQMYRDRPDFFRFNPDPNLSNAENWSRHVERIVSQTPGLSAKTGSFGAVWQEPGTAAISAIDRHMANQIGARIFPDDASRRAFEQRVIKNWNDSLPPKRRKAERVRDIDALLESDRGNTFFQDALLQQVGQHAGARVRTPKGALNPNLPEHLTPEQANWVREPKNVTTLGRFYREALSENARMAESEGLGLFGSQWLNWDRIRRRLEPHENMNPVLSRIPAMSLEQLQDARLMHRAMGSTNYKKIRPTPEQEAAALRAGDSVNSSPRLQPTSRVGNPSGLGYFAVPPALLGAQSLLGEDEQ